GRRQPPAPGRRLPVPLHVGGHGGGLRPQPPAPLHRRGAAAGLPLRPRRRGVLPPLAGRGEPARTRHRPPAASPGGVIPRPGGASSLPPWRSATWWYGIWSRWVPPTPWP